MTMIPEERRSKLLEYIRNKKTVNIPDIKQHFDISEITVRRDFNKLASQGLIKKVYGGATIIESEKFEPICVSSLGWYVQQE